MDESLRAQIETYLSHLNGLIRRGCQVRDTLATDPSNKSAMAATRVWQEECGVTVNQLSGGSKAHWLARSFSDAFLMRSAAGSAVEGAPPVEIVKRLLGVLEQAVGSLSRMDDGPVISASSEAPPRRFDFVHNPELRPIVEQAYADSRRALDQGDYDLALLTSCGILEAIVTDALEHKGLRALAASDVPAGKIADWQFEARLAVAERAGLIRGGCARLPAVARAYREPADAERRERAEGDSFRARCEADWTGASRRDARPESRPVESRQTGNGVAFGTISRSCDESRAVNNLRRNSAKVTDFKDLCRRGVTNSLGSEAGQVHQSSKSWRNTGCDGSRLPLMTAMSRSWYALSASDSKA